MVLLVIDAQEQITNEKLYNFEGFVDSVKRLIAAARANGVEVIYVRHDDGAAPGLVKGTDGFEVYSGFAPAPEEKIYDKTVNSAFRNTGLLEYLRGKDVRRVIVTGLQTDYCIDASVKCAFEHGFEVIVPHDANSTTDNAFMSGEQSYKYYNDFMWKNRYARCISVDETINLIGEYNITAK